MRRPLPRVATPAGPAQHVAGNALVYHATKPAIFWIDAAVNGAAVRFVVDNRREHGDADPGRCRRRGDQP